MEKAIYIYLEIDGKFKKSKKAYSGNIDHILRRLPKVLKEKNLPKNTKIKFNVGVFPDDEIDGINEIQKSFELE